MPNLAIILMRSPVSVRIVNSAPGTLLRAIGLIAVGSMVPSQGASSPISNTIAMTVAPNTTPGLRSNLRYAARLGRARRQNGFEDRRVGHQ